MSARAAGAAGRGPLVVLIGPPGAGKSRVGALLADLLGVAFRDTDADVEAVAGKPVADIFVQDGEPAFRALEREAVAAAIRDHRGVLAVGGGAVLDPDTQRLLAGHTVVYLAASLATLVRRNGMDKPRPLLIGNPRAQLKILLDQRLPVYERLASLTSPTDDDEPAQIAALIAARLATAQGAPGRPG